MKLFQWSDQLIQCTWTELTPYFTHVLVYQGHECTFVVDTFLGPGKMREMLAFSETTKIDRLLSSIPTIISTIFGKPGIF